MAILIIPQGHPANGKNKKKKSGTQLRVLLIDGQSINHAHWKEWTPVLLKQLDDSGLFSLDVATSPLKGESLDKFSPKFKNYDVVISLYDGDSWPVRTRRAFERFVEDGGGLVIIHAADNAFPDWKEYNQMIGLGGWGNRNEVAGPYVYIDQDGKTIRDNSIGAAGQHGPRHEFLVETRSSEHPIMKGLPDSWMHAEDELYGGLRGPAQNMTILATAYSSERFEGTQRHEPVMMVVWYGSGKVFHTTLGHTASAMSCVGFTTTLIRACQWVAGKEVNYPVPEDFPTDTHSTKRAY